MELSFVKLFFGFTLDSDVADPHLLFGCRTDFAAAFRSAVSCRRLDCTGCLAGATCPYPANFGQKMAKDPEAVKRHQKPPLPFVFDFPVLAPAPNRGGSYELGLTLFGTAVQHAPLYIAALERVLRCVPAALVAVQAQVPGGGRAALPTGPQPALPLLGALDPTPPGPLEPDRLSLHFVTPLKLVSEGRLLKSFTFSQLARSLMRRVSALAYYYEGMEPEVDYRWLSRCSESIRTVSSDCRFVSWGGRPAGILGCARFQGDLEPFHLFLQLGAATHLGKAASFGFGACRLGR